MDNIISVIIPTCNRSNDLRKCLKAIEVQKNEIAARTLEVIVSDDSTESVTKDMLLKEFDWATWTEGPRKGPAANRNHGASISRGDWLVFTDDDCCPQNGWLSAFEEKMKQPDRVLEGKTIASGTRTRVDEECPTNTSGGFLWSCNFAIPKRIYWELGGFDDRYPAAAMEDVDFHLRLTKSGITIEFAPEAIVQHPWRIEKGRSFLHSKAECIAFHVNKHPELKAKFSAQQRALYLLKHFLPRFTKNCISYRFRGALNALTNRLVLEYATQLNIRKKLRQR